MSSTPENGLYQVIGAFLHNQRVLNYAPGTLHRTEIYLRHFALYLENAGLYDLRSLVKGDLEAYQTFLREEHRPRLKKGRLADATVYSRWCTILLFFAFLVERGHLLYNPTLHIDRPRGPRRPRRSILTVLEMDRFLSQPRLNTKIGIRDRAILEVLYATGMRQGELLRLELFDLDLQEKTLRIRKAKFLKERVVPLSDVSVRYLVQYLSDVRPVWQRKNSDEKVLFMSFTGRPLDSSALQLRVQKYAELSKIRKKITPHLIRHACATHLLQGGADIFVIQELLGHASVESTQIYARASLESLKNVHRNCHPRGKSV